MKRLKHKNIINYISGWFDEDNNKVVIITEIFSSGSLRKYINKIHNPRLKLVKHWIKEILSGLMYLHELNPPVIHRDIKCDNIFIIPHDGTLKIGDLGYSCELKNAFAKSFTGTLEYIAPEVYEGKYTEKADIYSLGICIIEMVTCERPYKECDSFMQVYHKSKQNIMPELINSILNKNMVELIKICLQPEHARPSAKELLNIP